MIWVFDNDKLLAAIKALTEIPAIELGSSQAVLQPTILAFVNTASLPRLRLTGSAPNYLWSFSEEQLENALEVFRVGAAAHSKSPEEMATRIDAVGRFFRSPLARKLRVAELDQPILQKLPGESRE